MRLFIIILWFLQQNYSQYPDFTQDMGPGPGQREESQRETTITLRQPEIRLRFDILSSLCSAQCPQLHITFHNHRQGASSSWNELDLATWFPGPKEGCVT